MIQLVYCKLQVVNLFSVFFSLLVIVGLVLLVLWHIITDFPINRIYSSVDKMLFEFVIGQQLFFIFF